MIVFKLQTLNTCLFRLTDIREEYGRSLSAFNANSTIVMLRRKRFLTDWCLLDQWSIVRRRPFRKPLTASPVYVCIYSLSRPPAIWEVSTWLKLFFQSRIRRDFPTKSICIGFRYVWAPGLHSSHQTISNSCKSSSSFVLLTLLQTDEQTNFICFRKTLLSVEETVHWLTLS